MYGGRGRGQYGYNQNHRGEGSGSGNYPGTEFNGNFGNFDQGFYDGGYRQGYGYGGNQGYQKPFYNRNTGGRGGYNGGRARFNSVQRNETVGQGQKDALNDGSNVVSTQGTSSGSFDTAMVQAGAAAAQLNLQQGAAVEQAYVAKATGVVPKGKKRKMFQM
jgi:hypothetical protein